MAAPKTRPESKSKRPGACHQRLVLGMHDGLKTFAHVLDVGKHFRWQRGGRVEQLVGATDHKPPYWRKAGRIDTLRVCEFISENS